MSYGPLDMYRNPGPSGPQPRDFNSIIQTCSGNIQRISQASEPRDPAGSGGRPAGQAWVRVPRRGARSRPQPGPLLRPPGASTPGAASCLPRVGQARALQVHTPVLGVVSSRCWVDRADLTARGWEGSVCHLLDCEQQS